MFRVLKVHAILLVLAEHLEDILVGHERVRNLDGECLGIRLRIVEGHLDVEMSEVDSAETFRHPERFAVWMSYRIEWGSVVEASGLDDEDIAFPASN